MTNVCNIFRPLSEETGNFLMFSQYTDDLSRSTTDPSYKVVPSRFLCLDLTPDNIENIVDPWIVWPEGDNPDPGDIKDAYNVAFVKLFQNLIENGASLMRSDPDASSSINNITFSTNFFGYMTYGTMLYEGDDDGLVKIQDNIVYDGNIDLQSWEKGFGEILLNIQSGSKKKTYEITQGFYSDSDPLSFEKFCEIVGTQQYYNFEDNYQYYISGWYPTDDPQPPLGSETFEDQLVFTNSTGIFDNTSVYDTMFASEDDPTATSFTFNTIVILYNIEDEEGNIVYEDIPMGIYFTGVIDVVETAGDENVYGIKNPVTIYTNSTDAYGAGSGWSLRICTRFTPTPHGYLKVEEVAVDSGVINDNISALMSATAEVVKTVNGFASKTFVDSQAYRDLYAMFKNSKTNVPYIVEVNGVGYWFVNGRNTGYVAGTAPNSEQPSI